MEVKKLSSIKEDLRLYSSLVDREYSHIPLKTNLSVKWKCEKCNVEWIESIISRKRYDLCPDCQPRKPRRSCQSKDCKLSASYNYPQYDWPRFCSKHREADMIEYSQKYIAIPECNGVCDDAVHVGGGSYVCDHNSLASLYPDISKQWDFKSNTGLGPNSLSPGSRRKIHWVCSEGHKFSCRIANRVRKNTGCPQCRNKHKEAARSLSEINKE